MRKKRLLFLLALLMAAGVRAQEETNGPWTSGGCTVTFDGVDKITVSKTAGGDGKMDDYLNNTFKLTNNLNWYGAKIIAQDKDGNPLSEEWNGKEAEIIGDENDPEEFIITVPDGAVIIIVANSNEPSEKTEAITDFRHAGYNMTDEKNDNGDYIVEAYGENENSIETPWNGIIGKVRKLIVEEGVTYIGANAFYNDKLKNIKIKTKNPPTLGSAFYNKEVGVDLMKPELETYVGFDEGVIWGRKSVSGRYYDNLAEGTEDADNWKAKVSSEDPEPLPALPVHGKTVTANYSGSLKVKNVTVKRSKLK